MKRRIFKLAPRITLFLLLGAIINIAVAWMDAVQSQEWAKRMAPKAFLTLDKAIRFGHPYNVRTESLRGWPWPSLRHPAAIRIAQSVDTGQFGLPCEIIAGGFAINTIFYAAVLWLPFAAFGRIRRRRRIKRGLCPACAYPLGTSAVCSECGRPTPLKQ